TIEIFAAAVIHHPAAIRRTAQHRRLAGPVALPTIELFATAVVDHPAVVGAADSHARLTARIAFVCIFLTPHILAIVARWRFLGRGIPTRARDHRHHGDQRDPHLPSLR